VRVVRRRETSKENNARANDDRHNEQRNEIFLPGWPKCKFAHGMRVYGLCAFNQRVSIFLDCAGKRKGCSKTPLKENRTEFNTARNKTVMERRQQSRVGDSRLERLTASGRVSGPGSPVPRHPMLWAT